MNAEWQAIMIPTNCRSEGAPLAALRRTSPSRLLDDSRRAVVWPDSVQVLGGKLSLRLPTYSWVWLTIGLRPVERRDEAWLKKGLPCS